MFTLIMSCTALAQPTEVDCLARNIYHEARGENEAGWMAVAWTTLNRTQDGRFPSTICKVVNQPHQFSWTSMKLKVRDIDLYKRIREVAVEMMDAHAEGEVPKGIEGVKHALYFDSMRPKRAKGVVTIGHHNFYEVK